MNKKILVVEDNAGHRNLIQRYLSPKGYQLDFAQDGTECLEKVKANRPDLIILDLYLPDIDGLNICEIIKKDKLLYQIPVVMVTARGSVTDIVSGLKAGADDYLSKPYDHEELLARVEAVLRRYENQAVVEAVLTKGTITLSLTERKVLVGKDEINGITRKEFDLLYALMKRSPQILNVQYLLQTVWGNEPSGSDRHTVETHMYTLRKKLGAAAGGKIVSVYGFGYKFEE